MSGLTISFFPFSVRPGRGAVEALVQAVDYRRRGRWRRRSHSVCLVHPLHLLQRKETSAANTAEDPAGQRECRGRGADGSQERQEGKGKVGKDVDSTVEL